MNKCWPILTLLLCLFGFDNNDDPATKKYPGNYFRSPVDHNLLLSGTFGELRPNHFHAGIDIKSSKGVPGDRVFAAAAGYISAIRVEESGYGNSLYINHPNGYSTLYAHLDRFPEHIATFVKEQQYAKRSFRLNLQLTPDVFPVQQGEQIGNMGNSGSSNGAHLHFEVRQTATRRPINPLLFGLPVADNVSPRMHSLKVYLLNDKMQEEGARIFSVYQSDGDYRVKGDTLLIDGERAGFGLKVYDHFDRVSNWNGIYALSMFCNDSLTYSFDLESFSFEETRYLNAHCDYQERITHNSYYNRCFTLPGNLLSIYRRKDNYGLIQIPDRKPSKITLLATDLAGNKSRLEFWVRRGNMVQASPNAANPYNYLLPFDEGNMIRTQGLYLHMSAGTLYQDLYMNYQVSPERSDGCFSDVHHLHEPSTPVHQYFDLGIRPTVPIPAELKSKVFVALCDGKDVVNCGGFWEDGLLRTQVRQLGDYSIMADTTPPSVKPLTFRNNLRGAPLMSFRISDKVATAPNVEPLAFEAFVDDQWILMEYDKKLATITHRFDDRIGPGEHSLRLVVRDAVGNETVYEAAFLR